MGRFLGNFLEITGNLGVVGRDAIVIKWERSVVIRYGIAIKRGAVAVARNWLAISQDGIADIRKSIAPRRERIVVL